MDRMARFFLYLTIVGPLHMIEQMFTSLEEFHMIRDALGGYYAWFAPANADLASVILITLVWTLVSCLMYAIMRGGAAMRGVLYVFGVFGVTELHHLQEAFSKGGYDAGVITCIPYAVVGAMLVKAVWDAGRQDRVPVEPTPALTVGR
jgi:uncharacterized membrane protein YeaQ/YmgE (transglycosylase-associated protein family)